MNISTWAVVFATLLGPILAVQAQQFIARRTEKKQRRLWLFRSLMNTRAGALTAEHVNALNAVPLEFHTDRVIMQKWRTYLDHLGNKALSMDVWGDKRVELYTDLLAEMARRLRYGFDPLQLKNEIYNPQGHIDLETDQQVIRRGVVALMKGERALPLDVRSIAQSPEATKRTAALEEALIAWLNGKTAPKVKLDGEGGRASGSLQVNDRT